MNNHHDIVYVPNEKGTHYVSQLGTGTGVKSGRLIKPLKDVFVFTKEQLDKEPLAVQLLKELIDAYEKGKEPVGNSGFRYVITPAFSLAIEKANKKFGVIKDKDI